MKQVIEWGRDGTTIEADQRLGWNEQTPLRLHVLWKNFSEGHARDDESEGDNRRRRRRRLTQSKHEWDDVNEGHQPQMADDDTSDSQALTGGDITRHRALVARISCLSQDLTSSLLRCKCAAQWPSQPALRDTERVKRIGRYLAGKPRARCWFRWQQSGELDVYSDADWGGDKATRRSVSAGVIMRCGHCLKIWTKKQEVVSLSSAESE